MPKRTTLIICMLLILSFTVIFPIKTSVAASPILKYPYPSGNATYNPRLSINVSDADNDLLTVTFKSNASGIWETLGTYSDGNKRYTQNTSNMDVKNKTYYWCVNATDGTHWANKTYSFIAQALARKWRYFPSPRVNTSIAPLAADVNNDGIYEIFSTGNYSTGMGKATCVSGSTGALIWQYYNNQIDYHSPFELADLNNDGIQEMVISCNETTVGEGVTIALHANNGSVYWIANHTESGGKYLCVADIEGNGYPYVYICSGDFSHGVNGTGRLRKLRGTDGTVLKETFVWRPCWGGISIADADNDGKFEVYMAERCANYKAHNLSYPYNEGQLSLGMQCFDAETLDTLWYQDAVTCSSHCTELVDVNHDGVLDAVNLQQGGGGVYVVDGATWDKMPGYWQNNVNGLNPHSPFPIYDIDGDGKLEIIVVKEKNTPPQIPARMWKLGQWNTYIELANFSEPPKMANVLGDDKLEIIGASNYSNGVEIFNTTGQLIETIKDTLGGLDTTLVQDIDNDGRNELIILSGDGVLQCYNTSAYSPTPRVRTNNQLYSERRDAVGVYVPPPGAPQPIVKTISPLNNTQDVPLNPTLCARVIDYQVHELKFNYIVEHHYDKMNITISTNATGSWVPLASYSNVGNDWYNFSTSTMNAKNTTYYWRVTAQDINPNAHNITTTQTYRFTTIAPPTISNIVATPSVISPGQSVNITGQVTDGTSVNAVKVNITAPKGQKTNTTPVGGSPTWSVLKYDDFESGMGDYTLGGSSASLYNGVTYSHHGTKAVKIQDYQGLNSSFYLTQPIDLDTPRYTSIKVDFWFKAHNMSNLTNFWVKYYDGQHWRIVDNYIKPGSQGNRPSDKPFNNDTFTHGITWINESKYTFPTNMKIRFECDALSSSNTVYIDQVYINATTQQGPNYYLNNTYTRSGIYQYFIWANDIHGNSYTTGSKSFTISGNHQPNITDNPNPSNGSSNNDLDLIWSIPIIDSDGDAFSWTIQCSNGQVSSGFGASNGTKSLSLSGLAYSTTYKVWVNATDPTGSGLYTRIWYMFTTNGGGQPVFGSPSPANGSTGNPVSLTWSIPINDSEGDQFNWTILSSNGQTNSGTNASNGTKSLTLSGLANSITYKVWVNATDPTGSGLYTKKWFTFATISSGGGGGGGGETPPIEPQNKKPIANISAGEPYQGFVNTEILFDGSRSYDPDGYITKWFWVFGDNTNGTGKTIQHTYSKAGMYSVTLTVTDNKSATNTATTTCVITQRNRPPTTPVITGPTNGTKNTLYTYTAVSIDPDNDTIQYMFNWGDTISQSSGFLPNGTTFTMNHSWAAAGRYNITVTVTDNQNESSSKITVYIDAIQIGDIGYLLDNNNDGTYDAFYSDVSKQITAVQNKNGHYNIDSDGNGNWDYTFDATNGLTSYQQPKTPGFEIIIIIGAIALVMFWKRKRTESD